MADETLRSVHVDVRRESYSGFLGDDSWAEQFVAVTEPHKNLSEISIDLMMDWRATSYTLAFPSVIFDQMKAYHDGFVKTDKINTTLLRIAEFVLARLEREIPDDLSADPAISRRLRQKIVQCGAEFAESSSGAAVEFPLDETWEKYVKEPAFGLSLWGSQRTGYLAIFSAFENYLVRAVRIALSNDEIRSSRPDFKDRIVEAFGEDLRNRCWTDSKVHTARLARNALAHAGGRVTDELRKHRHNFEVREGRIEIEPKDTKALFKLFKESALAIATNAATMRQFD